MQDDVFQCTWLTGGSFRIGVVVFMRRGLVFDWLAAMCCGIMMCCRSMIKNYGLKLLTILSVSIACPDEAKMW